VRCIRARGPWIIPVVIHGDARVSVDDIDPRSIELEGMSPLSFFGLTVDLRFDVDGDGDRDLVVFIRHERGHVADDATSATLTAELDDGTTISGHDDICRNRQQ
jgi:hypothetical protein